MDDGGGGVPCALKRPPLFRTFEFSTGIAGLCDNNLVLGFLAAVIPLLVIGNRAQLVHAGTRERMGSVVSTAMRADAGTLKFEDTEARAIDSCQVESTRVLDARSHPRPCLTG